MAKLTKIAKWLFGLYFIFVSGGWLYTFITNETKDAFGLFSVSCGVFALCGIIVRAVGSSTKSHLEGKRGDIYQTLNCATWWTCTGTVYIFGLFMNIVAMLPGFLFLLFSLFIWLEWLRLVFLSCRADKANKSHV
jgi:hypothetical protein